MRVGFLQIALLAVVPLALVSASARMVCRGDEFPIPLTQTGTGQGAVRPDAGALLAAPEPPALVQVLRRPVKDTVQVTGRLRSASRMLVVADEASVVERVLVREGQEVRRGDAIAILTPRSQRAQKASAKSRVIPDQAPLKSPMGGTVSEILTEPGQIVQAGAGLLSVVDMSSSEIQAVVHARDAVRIRRGMEGVVQIEGFGSREFTGKVERIAPETLGEDRFIRVWISLPSQASSSDPKLTLRGGVAVFGEIVVNRVESAAVLPSTAVRSDEGGDFVICVKDGRQERIRVVAGPYWEDGALIQIEGLEPGTEVLADPLRLVPPPIQPDKHD